MKTLITSTIVFLSICSFAQGNWIGKWLLVSHHNNSELKIISEYNNTIKFELNASSGAHTGYIEGDAILVNKTKAIYSFKDEYSSCLIEFIIKGDSMVYIDQKVEEGDCGAGLGVGFSGEYLKPNLVKEEVVDLVSLYLLETKEQDNAFKKLVGSDYEKFIYSTQLTYSLDDLDKLNTKVYSAGVRGLFTIMECIIMIDSDYKIWAAVIDGENVLYYTNSNLFRNEIPKTIKKWMVNFSNLEIIYK